jgi:hypothetical protein
MDTKKISNKLLKYNRDLFIIFLILSLMLLIVLYNCQICNDCKTIEKYGPVTSYTRQVVIFKKNEDLFKRYRLYNEDLMFTMNKNNEYYVKDTNKKYAQYILNLKRNATYYNLKLFLIQYPVTMRVEPDGYYIDYNINNRIIPNKVMDIQWEDFDAYPFKTIITIYKDDNNFLNYIKDLLKDYNGLDLEFQTSNNIIDVIYDRYMTMDFVTKAIQDNKVDAIINRLADININDKIELLNYLNNINLSNSQTQQLLYYATKNTDKISTIIKSDLFKKIVKVDTENVINFTKSDTFKSLLKETEKMLKYVKISIETRDERYLFLFDEKNPESINQLIHLFNYIYNHEDLQNLNDLITKNVRYYKIPINIMRVLINFKGYLKAF